MTINLTEEQEQAVERQLASGRFASRDEVISEALALLEQQDDVLADVRQAYREGHEKNAQLDTDETIRRIEQEIREHRRKYYY